MKPYKIYRENGAWHFNTVCGLQIGPFWMKKHAAADMDRWREMEGLSYVQGGGWRFRE